MKTNETITFTYKGVFCARWINKNPEDKAKYIYCACYGEYNEYLCNRDAEHPTRYTLKRFPTLKAIKKAINKALL